MKATWYKGQEQGHEAEQTGRIMAKDILIREASPGELAEIETLIKTAYQEFQPLMPEAAWQRWMDNIGETLRAPGGQLLVAERHGRIEGAVTFYPDAGQAHQGHWPTGAAAIRLLAVRPSSRGRGYGIRLTEACLGRGRELQIGTIFLYTGTFMAAARHIYEKLGFKRAQEFDRTPGPIAYRLDL
jgi:N-acetylglutamate synthase-like GNAT family acetyltransferase